MTRVRRAVFPMMGCAAVWSSGCLGRLTPADCRRSPTTSGPTFTPPDPHAGGSVFERRAQRLAVEFKVHRISAPRGTFTPADARIWELVVGRLPSAALTLHLADNGFRAAIGREPDRKILLEYLSGLSQLRTAVDRAMPDASRLVELELGACAPRVTVFYYDEGGRMHGSDFVEAKAKLLVSFEMRSMNLQEVCLRLTPSLEEPPGPLKWVMTPGGPAQVAEERRRVFDALSLWAPIPPEGFLLLGATETVYDRPLVARPFFIEELPAAQAGADSRLRESVYVISPVVRAYGGGGPGGASGPDGLRPTPRNP